MDSQQDDSTLDVSRHHAMLFCPPQPPLHLQPGSTVVIGRHNSCDLSVRCEDVSRRHAEVRADGSRFEIEDLSSTNGTFVNGEMLAGPQTLVPGDRIEIGSMVVTFCYIEATLDADPIANDGNQTLLQLDPPTSEAFRGSLCEIPAFALLQVMEMNSQTGVLQIDGNDLPGRIWFANGMPIHAECGKQVGFDAALQLVSNRQGRFRFEPNVAPAERTIEASITELLMEACRQADEANEASNT